MKLSVKKDKLVNLSNDKEVLPSELTSKIAAGSQSMACTVVCGPVNTAGGGASVCVCLPPEIER